MQKSPCHDVKLLRRGVNVFTDLQSTCDFVCFAVVLSLKLPLRTCHVTCVLRRRFVVSKDFRYRTLGATAVLGEPDDEFSLALRAELMQGAAHPALYVPNDDTSAVRVKLADVQEVMRTWYIAFYTPGRNRRPLLGIAAG